MPETLDCLAATTLNLFKAYGDDPRAAGASMARARRRLGLDPG